MQNAISLSWPWFTRDEVQSFRSDFLEGLKGTARYSESPARLPNTDFLSWEFLADSPECLVLLLTFSVNEKVSKFLLFETRSRSGRYEIPHPGVEFCHANWKFWTAGQLVYVRLSSVNWHNFSETATVWKITPTPTFLSSAYYCALCFANLLNTLKRKDIKYDTTTE